MPIPNPGTVGENMNLRHLDDGALLESLAKLVRQEREDTAEIVAHLAEGDSRNLAEERG